METIVKHIKRVMLIALSIFIIYSSHAASISCGFTSGLKDDPKQMYTPDPKDTTGTKFLPVVDGDGHPIYQHDYSGKVLGAWVALDAYLDNKCNWLAGIQSKFNMAHVDASTGKYAPGVGVKMDDITIDLSITRIF